MNDPRDSSAVTEKLQQAKDALSSRMLELSQRSTVDVETHYNVVFTGRFTLPEPQVVQNLAAFFKQGSENTRRLLQAGRTLKTYQEKTPADKLARLLTGAGAECRVIMETDAPADEPSTLQKAAFALDSAKIPLIRLPVFRRFGRVQWLVVGGVFGVVLLLTTWLLLKPPVVQGNTAAEYEASIERVVEKTQPEQRAAVRHAIALLTEASMAAQQESATTDAKTAARLSYAPVAGKNSKQILVMAEARLERKREAYRVGLAQADEKIAELDKQLAAQVPDNVPVLSKIVITEAGLGWPEGARTPNLAFVITNGSNENLMRVFLQGYLYDDNGNLLVSNAVTYAVAGGLAPGRSASLTLPTLSDSPWASDAVRNQKHHVFQLRVANAENQQGKPLGKDYRPLENDKQRQLDWKKKVQAELSQISL